MLWTIFVILLVLWLLGMVSSYTIGGFIHVLLVIALVVLLINIIGGLVIATTEHVIDNERAKQKADAKNATMSVEKQAKRKSKAQLKKPPAGTVASMEKYAPSVSAPVTRKV